jgi:hypothetical protein
MKGLRIIFVHGISPTVITWDYSDVLTQMIMARLRNKGVIPSDATPDEVEEIVSFEQVNYSDIGSEEEMELLAAYEAETKKLYNFVYRLSKVAGLDKVRRQIITSVSDVMVYESDYWHNIIQGMVLDKIKPYVGTGDAVTLVAHSLGSVVAFDTIHENLHHNAEWEAAGFRPTNLFTMGSPLALFSLDLDHVTGLPNHRHKGGEQGESLLQEGGVWYNFLDAQDIIAYPLEILFEKKYKLEDIVVQTGTNPRKAHDGYWQNEEVADVISERLKMDFQRVNTRPTEEEREQIALAGESAIDQIVAGSHGPEMGEMPTEVETGTGDWMNMLVDAATEEAEEEVHTQDLSRRQD